MSYSDLKGFSDFGDNMLDDQLRANLISFFNWGLLNRGTFNNVTIPTSGQYGGDKCILKYRHDKRYTDGQVWQGFRSNWVSEAGVHWSGAPISISGVYVNNTFYPSSTSGAYAHYIDYPRGRVIFNSAISTSSVVKAEYSYKHINVIDADEVPFLRALQSNSFELDSIMYGSPSSGDYSLSPDVRIQLPAIAVEVTSDMRFRPYQVGGGQYVSTKVLFHVIAENQKQATKIATIISTQNDKAIDTFDVNQISKYNLAPLTYKGSIASGALNHEEMVNTYKWKKLVIKDMQPVDGQWLDTVFYVPVKFRAEIILNNI